MLISVCICKKSFERIDRKPSNTVAAWGALSVWWGGGGEWERVGGEQGPWPDEVRVRDGCFYIVSA